MLPWLKPRTATLAELEEQFAAATKACDAAAVATDAAQDVFDAEGDDAAARALTKARDALDLTREHYARAERLVLAARAKRDAEERARLEARLAEVRTALSGEQLQQRRAAALAPTIAAIIEAAESLPACAAEEFGVRELESERTRIEVALGQERTHMSDSRRVTSRSLLCDTLLAAAKGKQHDSPARNFLESLVIALNNAEWI